ncbi:MAG: 50S ribosomal protein L25/general stress protein Ctc, partial [Dongiaceae bacterium]
RTDQGKGASRHLRRTGKVPAIIYGGKDPAQQLALSHHEMKKHLETEAFYSHILTLKFDGKEQQAVLKDIQRHPAEPILMHFDFQRVFADQAIRMEVPLHFVGGEKCPGVKVDGGLIEHQRVQVEVECLPKDLPEFVEVDLSHMKLNETIHLSHLKLPAGVTLIELRHGNDQTVASVHIPRVIVEEAPVAETAPAEVPALAVKSDAELAAAKAAEGAKPGAPGAKPAAAAAPEAKKEEKKK